MGYGNAFLGMRGTGDWATDERPKNWRESILFLYPNGMAPLTAIMSKMASEKVDDPQYHWWTKMLQHQGGDVAGNYDDFGLSSEIGSNTRNKGAVVYSKVKEDVAMHFREGHQVMLREEGDHSSDTVGKVIDVMKNGDNSYVAIKLLQDSQTDCGDLDKILIIGTMNPEGAPMPKAIAYNPVKWYNYTQIFRTPLSITRTARNTRLRTADAYKEAKRECLEYHSIEMEKAFLFGYPSEETGDNGKPERSTCGLINAIRGTNITGHAGTGHGGKMADFATAHSSSAWVDAGEEWLDSTLEEIFRYGSQEKLCFAGSGALLGINKLVKNKGNFEFKHDTKAYGIKVTEWHTAFGMINIMTHPLFSFDPVNRHSMVIFEPKDIKFRYITDTTFYPDQDKQNTGRNRVDGTDEEYLTEAGLEYHHPIGWGYLNNVGVDQD